MHFSNTLVNHFDSTVSDTWNAKKSLMFKHAVMSITFISLLSPLLDPHEIFVVCFKGLFWLAILEHLAICLDLFLHTLQFRFNLDRTSFPRNVSFRIFRGPQAWHSSRIIPQGIPSNSCGCVKGTVGSCADGSLAQIRGHPLADQRLAPSFANLALFQGFFATRTKVTNSSSHFGDSG